MEGCCLAILVRHAACIHAQQGEIADLVAIDQVIALTAVDRVLPVAALDRIANGEPGDVFVAAVALDQHRIGAWRVISADGDRGQIENGHAVEIDLDVASARRSPPCNFVEFELCGVEPHRDIVRNGRIETGQAFETRDFGRPEIELPHRCNGKLDPIPVAASPAQGRCANDLAGIELKPVVTASTVDKISAAVGKVCKQVVVASTEQEVVSGIPLQQVVSVAAFAASTTAEEVDPVGAIAPVERFRAIGPVEYVIESRALDSLETRNGVVVGMPARNEAVEKIHDYTGIGARIAQQIAVADPTVERIRSGPAFDRVVAGAALDRVLQVRAYDRGVRADAVDAEPITCIETRE